jgi:hypothetical protein
VRRRRICICADGDVGLLSYREKMTSSVFGLGASLLCVPPPRWRIGCIWFAFIGQPDSRGVDKQRLVVCTAPESGSPDANPPCLHLQKRQKRPFLQSQARLILSLMY